MLQAFIDDLPPESATKTAVRNGYSDAELADMAKGHREHGPWSHLELLVAHVADEVAQLTHITSTAHGGKGERPKPYPRPGVSRADGQRRGRLTAQQMARLDQMSRRRG